MPTVKSTGSTSIATAPSPNLFEALAGSTKALFWDCDADGRLVHLSPAWQRTLGKPLASMIGQRLDHLGALELSGPFPSAIAQEGGMARIDGVFPSDAGAPVHLALNAVPFLDGAGRIAGFFGSAFDISEQKHSEKRLRENEARFRMIADHVDDVIWNLSLETGLFTFVSPSIYKLRGYTPEECLGQSIADALTPESLQKATALLHQTIAGWKPGDDSAYRFISDLDQLRKDGSIVPTEVAVSLLFDTDGKPRELIGVSRDITFRKQAEERMHALQEALQRTDKLAALGVLAGGIAHDFNNLLAGLFGHIELARITGFLDDKAAQHLDGAMTAFARAKDLTRQLLTFAKGGEPVLRTASLGPLLMDCARFALSGSNVVCEFQVAPDLHHCAFDSNQIAQVVDNLVINAKQAMPGGGTLWVSAVNTHMDEGSPLRAGDYVRVDIRDTGPGIPQDLLKKIFDPYFTTKPMGNGLGLATCHSILQRHNGSIEVKSTPGDGCTFSFFLPSVSEGMAVSPRSPVIHQGHGAILIMDDNDLVRDVLRCTLTDMGYSVVAARNGEEAIDLASIPNPSGTPLCAAILDLTIPGSLGGLDTAEALRKKLPTLPLFATSGYSDDPVMARPGDFGFSGCLRKPFLRDELAALLSQHLR